MRLKFTEELCVMRIKNDTKFEGVMFEGVKLHSFLQCLVHIFL